ncbi:MAG: hypothetical protein WB689_37780 [Xanthobacteraceae bacterium]
MRIPGEKSLSVSRPSRNQRHGDLPVLRYRAMVNRISAAGLQVRQFLHRYTDDAVDLCDVLGSYVPGGKVKLDEVSKILRLPGKPDGVDGSHGIARIDKGTHRVPF